MSNIVPFQELESMAGYIVRSKLFGAKDESQAMSLMLIAQAEGCHPMTAVQDFDVVQGRPARKTHSILSRFQAAGGSVAWEEISEQRAIGVFTHKQGGSLRVEWTFEQAKKIGLTGKDNWKNYPKAMLRARCIAEGVRAVFPGAIGGMMSVEEAQDTDFPKDSQSRPDWIDVGPYITEAQNTDTDAEALNYWKTNNPKFIKQPADHKRLKEAVSIHRENLRAKDEARTVEMPTNDAATNDFVDAMDKAYDKGQ